MHIQDCIIKTPMGGCQSGLENLANKNSGIVKLSIVVSGIYINCIFEIIFNSNV